MFYQLQDQINKLVTGPNQAAYDATSAQALATQALTEASAANAQGVQALMEAEIAIAQGTQAIQTANSALAEAQSAYALGSQSIQKNAYTITNASNQLTAINGTGITVYSGASSTSGARVVMNSAGLAGYNSSGTATFSILSSTGAVSTNGAIFTNSSISGGSLSIGGRCTIDTNGYLIATGATITGAITATSGTFTGTVYASAGTFTGTITSSNATITGGSLSVGANFQVNTSGQLTASSANISGTITTSNLSATGGTIGGWTISSTKLYTGPAGNENQYLNAAGGGLLTGAYTIGSVGTVGNVTVGSNLLLGGSVTSANFNLSSSTEFRVPFSYNNTQANAANVWISSTGQLRRATGSSIDYKTDIVNLVEVPELNPTLLYDLPVRAFRFKESHLPATDDRSGVLVPGFIAQEIDAIYPIAADYENGNIVNWNDKFLVPSMLSLIQDLNNRVKTLEGK